MYFVYTVERALGPFDLNITLSYIVSHVTDSKKNNCTKSWENMLYEKDDYCYITRSVYNCFNLLASL